MLASQWSIKMDSQYKPTYNAQATQQLPVITNLASDTLSFFHWGVIPGMAKMKTVSPKLLTLDHEELKSKAIHQSNLMNSRCVIPMQGFYWSRPIGKRKSSPMYVFLDNHQPIMVAGVWSQFDDFDGNVHYTFKMIIEYAEGDYSAFGEHVPLIIPGSSISAWLGADMTLESLSELMTLPEWSAMGTYAVSPRVLDRGNDDEGLIKATNPTDQHGNYTLFD